MYLATSGSHSEDERRLWLSTTTEPDWSGNPAQVPALVPLLPLTSLQPRDSPTVLQQQSIIIIIIIIAYTLHPSLPFTNQWCGASRHCLASRQPRGRIFTASASVSVTNPAVSVLASVLTNLPRSCYCLEALIKQKPIFLPLCIISIRITT